jgi:adenine-specific DNA-methyltransferase
MSATLHHGDCLDVMAGLPDNSVDLVLTDPPYFKVKGDAWDWQWKTPGKFLSWLDDCAAQWHRLLKPNGSLYVFASSRMAWHVEGVLRERFTVLNRIAWVKGDANGNGMHSRTEKAILRAWFPQTEVVFFCEHVGADNIAKGEAGYEAKCDQLRGFVFEPLRAYLAGERDRAGWTTRGVAEAFQQKTGSRTVTGMAGHWFERVQWTLPTAANYDWLRDLLNASGGDDLRREYDDLRREYDDLRREYDDLRREYDDLRRPFSVTPDIPYTDVWTFPTVQAYRGKHPCEKPDAMLRHIIAASSRPGAVVLDSFAGSGSTGAAAVALGRTFIGIEQDAQWIAKAQARIDATQPAQAREAPASAQPSLFAEQEDAA